MELDSFRVIFQAFLMVWSTGDIQSRSNRKRHSPPKRKDNRTHATSCMAKRPYLDGEDFKNRADEKGKNPNKSEFHLNLIVLYLSSVIGRDVVATKWEESSNLVSKKQQEKE